MKAKQLTRAEKVQNGIDLIKSMALSEHTQKMMLEYTGPAPGIDDYDGRSIGPVARFLRNDKDVADASLK